MPSLKCSSRRRRGGTLRCGRELALRPDACFPTACLSKNPSSAGAPTRRRPLREQRMKTFYTVRDVEDMHASGTTEIRIHDDVVLTDVAREKAVALGMRLTPVDAPPSRREGSGGTTGDPPTSPPPRGRHFFALRLAAQGAPIHRRYGRQNQSGGRSPVGDSQIRRRAGPRHSAGHGQARKMSAALFLS